MGVVVPLNMVMFYTVQEEKPEKPATLLSCENIESLMNYQPSDPASVRPILEDLRRQRRELGPNDNKVAELWNSLGLVRLHIQNDPHAARECQQEALRIQRRNQVNVLTAATLNDLALCYERICESDHALELYMEAKRILGCCSVSAAHPVAISVNRAVARLQRV